VDNPAPRRDFGDHLNTCTQHACATSGAHEMMMSSHTYRAPEAIHQGGIQNGPQARATQPRIEGGRTLDQGLPAAGNRDVIVDVTCRHEFRGSCANQERNGEPHTSTSTELWMQLLSSTTTNTTTRIAISSSSISSSSRQSRRPQGESAETSSACFTY